MQRRQQLPSDSAQQATLRHASTTAAGAGKTMAVQVRNAGPCACPAVVRLWLSAGDSCQVLLMWRLVTRRVACAGRC